MGWYSVRVSGGSIASVDPWRSEGSDGISGSPWNCSTHAVRLFNGATAAAAGENTIVVNGIIFTVAGFAGDPEIKITTAQGDFGFRLSELAYGKPVSRLEEKVQLDRVPAPRFFEKM